MPTPLSSSHAVTAAGHGAARRDPIGWVDYAWLIYALAFLAQPALLLRQGRLGWGSALLTAGAFVLFLLSYVRGLRARGRELGIVVALQATLGLILSPFNVGAPVFLVYAATFAARVERSRLALRLIFTLAALTWFASWMTTAPLYVGLSMTVLTAAIGGAQLQDMRLRRSNRALRAAQTEIQHLAAVAERERIARDLHDVLGHTLSLIVLKSELAAKLVTRDVTRATAEIRDVEQVARQALHDVRETIQGYRASIGAEAGRARDLLETAGVRAEVVLDAVALPRAAEEALALVIREASTNVARHADADTCRVSLDTEGSSVVLRVEDDGASDGSLVPGSGLGGMRERIEAVGGDLAWRAAPSGHGLVLEARVPLPASTASVPLTPTMAST